MEPLIYPPDPSEYLKKISSTLTAETFQLFPPTLLISYDDIRTAIKLLNKNSALGLDGFTPSLYSSFPAIIPILCQTFNNSYIRQQLTPTQSIALIKLIPKRPNPKTSKTGDRSPF